MAPTHYNSEDSHNKAQAMLADALEQSFARSEVIQQKVLDSYMRLADSIHAQHLPLTAAFQALEHLDQTPVVHSVNELLESAVLELLALTVDERLVSLSEKVEETESEICAVRVNTENVLEQMHRTTQTRNMLATNIFPSTVGNTTGDLVAECRLHAVSASRFEVSCGAIGSKKLWVREIGERDIYATLAIVVLGMFAGTLAISCAVTAMLCAAVRLLGGPQVRAFGKTWLLVVAACWVVCLVGI